MNYQAYRVGDIRSKLQSLGVRPLDIMVTGVTGAGKSTTLNTFFQKTVAKVGDGVDPETMKSGHYALNDVFRIWDTPGLGDGVQRDRQHAENIIKLLHHTYNYNENKYSFIDMVLVIIDGSSRDMGTTYKLLNEVILPHIQQDRILVAINQADFAMKGKHWLPTPNRPDLELKSFLDNQAQSIKQRIKEATGMNIFTPIYYSAKYDYNIKILFDFIISHIPSSRREELRL